MLALSDYDYHLPEELIAQEPTIPHHDARLLVCERQDDDSYQLADKHFTDLPELLSSDDVLFFNDTKVFKARLPLIHRQVTRHSGVQRTIDDGDILIFRLIDEQTVDALVSDSKNFKAGSIIHRDEEITLHVQSLTDDGVQIRIVGMRLMDFLEEYAQLPLPPYITYEKEKEQRYQTYFAENIGSAAAPTASLHFTPELMQSLEDQCISKQFLTLHVGLGTFKPVHTEDITQYDIHSEQIIVPHDIFATIADYKLGEKNIIPVGTTMIRTLESLPYAYIFLQDNITLTPEQKQFRDIFTHYITPDQAANIIQESFVSSAASYSFATSLYIYPGFTRRLIDGLVTNFHIPRSSLLMIIAAWMGLQNLHQTYRHAIDHKYRFYSFGDGMVVR
jgi:S-adenosylmethionine:tRNA ribosyltransferase-isomerase